jgi:hypothetical protein
VVTGESEPGIHQFSTLEENLYLEAMFREKLFTMVHSLLAVTVQWDPQQVWRNCSVESTTVLEKLFSRTPISSVETVQ